MRRSCVSDLGWIYTLFFVLLGSSAAIWGGWLERVGVRFRCQGRVRRDKAPGF